MRSRLFAALAVVLALWTPLRAASSANLRLQVAATLDTGTKSYAPPVTTLIASVGQFSIVSLAAGNTTVTPPAGTTAIVVVMPATSATITIKAITGDTGIPLSLSTTDPRWFVLPISTTFIVNASAPVANIEVLYL